VLNGATKSQFAGPEGLIALRTPLKPIFGKPKMLKQRGHWAISAAVAQLLYTQLVGGSNPSSPMVHNTATSNYMEEDTQFYRVIDNFLPEEEFTAVRDSLTSPTFPWAYHPGVDECLSEDEINDLRKYQFVYCFNVWGQWQGNPQVIYPVLNKLKPLSVLYVKLNLQVYSPEYMVNKLHADLSCAQNPEHMTAVYYINTCNGKTIFDTGEEINSVANRVLIFPGNRLHTGTSVTDSKTRYVLNVNFIQKMKDRWLPPIEIN